MLARRCVLDNRRGGVRKQPSLGRPAVAGDALGLVEAIAGGGTDQKMADRNSRRLDLSLGDCAEQRKHGGQTDVVRAHLPLSICTGSIGRSRASATGDDRIARDRTTTNAVNRNDMDAPPER